MKCGGKIKQSGTGNVHETCSVCRGLSWAFVHPPIVIMSCASLSCNGAACAPGTVLFTGSRNGPNVCDRRYSRRWVYRVGKRVMVTEVICPGSNDAHPRPRARLVSCSGTGSSSIRRWQLGRVCFIEISTENMNISFSSEQVNIHPHDNPRHPCFEKIADGFLAIGRVGIRVAISP